jgi:tetratricopeptide (TPR) repeat protein
MTAEHRAARRPLVPLAVLGLSIAIAGAGQLGILANLKPQEPLDLDRANVVDQAGSGAAQLDRERIAGDIAFWSARLEADPGDIVSATKLGQAQLESARATGDITAYLRAEAAADTALDAQPTYLPARTVRASALLALHRFAHARDAARDILAERPNDPAALGVLGDASLELGDVGAARGAYQTLTAVADSSAARIRRSHLSFIEGDAASAVESAQRALAAAEEEALEGPALAWYQYRLGDVLIATGDQSNAASAYGAALLTDPDSYLARSGLARVAAADGRWDEAIAHLDAAIAAVPLPDLVARRAAIYRLRGAAGDAEREQHDRETVLAIAALAGNAANVHDRTLSLYLADHELDPARALSLAEAEIEVRRDVYGYDALAWALLANGRPEDAEDAIERALSLGTRDARMLYHAGMIAAALGEDERAQRLLEESLALDSSFDPLAVARARTALATLP